ncbi:YjcZ family sporulation protein [Neobacillus soli]|nr:YjcZ family sporulation protein [Neobacillus soli]
MEFEHEHRERNPFALIVVLFILLIIIGASFMGGGY